MISASDRQDAGQTVLDRRPAPDETTGHRIAVLSAALLRAVMTTYSEDPETFAARAGITASIVMAVTDGACPAWELPYDEFTALADTVAGLWPCALFETAAACDLLLTGIVNGDQYMATDVLTDPSSQGVAQTLLRAAKTLLPDNLHALIRERAAELANSTSPDAWVGKQIASGFAGRQS